MTLPDRPFLRAFGDSITPPPLWLMRQAGRYLPEYRKLRSKVSNFQELCNTPDLAVEVTLQPIKRFGFDAAIIFSDILLLPSALGQDLRFENGSAPRLAPALRTNEDLTCLHEGNYLSCLAPTLDAIAITRSRLSKETSLIGFAGAPWTVATYMTRGDSTGDTRAEAKLFHYRDKKGFDRLLDILTRTTIAYLEKQVEAGADAIQLFESWAGDLPESVFRECSLKPITAITKSLRKKYPALPILLFSKGSGLLQKLYVTETDISAISIDAATPLPWARDELQPRKLVQGNLDPYALLAGGPQMESGIDSIMKHLSGGRFVFNLGHGILPATPVEHVERLVERVRGYKP